SSARSVRARGSSRTSAGASTSTAMSRRTQCRTARSARLASSTRTNSRRLVSGAAASNAAPLVQHGFGRGGEGLAAEELHELRPDRIREILNDLVHQRQRLRSSPGEAGLLEANRRSIVYWQTELSRALLAERGHSPVAQ